MIPGPVEMKITIARVQADPSCCREGFTFLSTQKSAKAAWDRLDHPGFVCFFLDTLQVWRGRSQAGLVIYTRTWWRLILLDCFLAFQLQCPSFFRKLIIAWAKRSVKFSIAAHWVVTGYFDDRRLSSDWWWPICAQAIKEKSDGVRDLLSGEA